MGLMSMLGKGPLSDKKVAKIAKLASNPFAQPEVRMREMQRLLDDGSQASLRGLLKRFAANASGGIADEDEKKFLVDAIADIGDDVLDPLRNYILVEKQLTYALRAYERIVGSTEALGFFIKVLEGYGPDSYRAHEAKVQLLFQLGEHLEDPRVAPALAPFLLDHSDEVRWAVMDLIERLAQGAGLTGDSLRAVCAGLSQQIFEDPAGPRIMRRAAELMCRYEWQVDGEVTDVPDDLDQDYFVDKKRYVRQRAKRGGS